MKTYPFKSVHFIKSALNSVDFPPEQFKEIAFAGRSNVGKSSLINALLNRKKIAKTSSTPGKTQTINFFSVDDTLMIVDLPGYGFAKLSRSIRENFSQCINDYLNQRNTLSLLLLLIDIRHPIRSEELELIEWAHHKGLPILLVFTKTDKLKRSELHTLQKEHALLPATRLYYSIYDKEARKTLIKKIEETIL